MPKAKLKWKNAKRKLSELVPHPKNPRAMTEKEETDLRASLKKFGLAEVPAVNTDGQLVAGHQRCRILLALEGDMQIDVRIPSRKLTEEEVNEYLIRSNKNTGHWDQELLDIEWDLEALAEWGFSDDELGAFDIDAIGTPELPEGGKDPFRQMTFTVHDEQFEEVEAALKAAKAEGGGDSAVNENGNGNALAWICGKFNRG